MKNLLPLLALAVVVTACSSDNARRRSLYSPAKASGPYTASLKNGTWKDKGLPIDEEIKQNQEQKKIDALGAKSAPQPSN